MTPDVSVRIEGSDIVITGAGAKEIRLKTGNYKVEASKDGKVVKQDVIAVTRNGRQVVHVSREVPPEMVAANESKKAFEGKPSLAIAPFDTAQAKKYQQAWANYLNLPVETENKLGMKLRLIPPSAEVPDAYYLGKYEATQGEWTQVMGYNPSHYGPKNRKLAGMDTSKFPVDQVSWYDCVEYCNKLSEREGFKPYYALTVKRRDGEEGKQIAAADVTILGGNGYQLPTAAEWEHACRAGTKTKYDTGDKDEDLLEYAWFDDNSKGRSHAVGEKKPNAFGLYDIHGNVRELTTEKLTNATTGADECALRGGDYLNPVGQCAVDFLYKYGPSNRHNSHGLRLARVAGKCTQCRQAAGRRRGEAVHR